MRSDPLSKVFLVTADNTTLQWSIAASHRVPVGMNFKQGSFDGYF